MKHKFLTTILSATGRLCLPVLFCVPVFLNGCGNSGADSDDVMNVSIFCDGEMPSPDNKIFKIIEEELGYHFEFHVYTGTGENERKNMTAKGEYTDLMTASTMLIDAGAAIPLEDYLPNYPNLYARYEEYLERMKYADGHIYTLPAFGAEGYETVTYNWHSGFFIQKAVLAEFGYPRITTLDEYFSLIEQYREKYPEIDGRDTIGYTICNDGYKNYGLVNPPALLAGYPNNANCIVDPVTHVASEFRTADISKRFYQTLCRANAKGLVDKDACLISYEQYMEKLSRGNVLGFADEMWNVKEANESLEKRGLYERMYVSIPLVFEPDIVEQYDDYNRLSAISGYMISTDCEEPEKILEMFDTLLEEKWQKLMVWGIEGEDYLIDESGMFYRTEEMREEQSLPDWEYENSAQVYFWHSPKIEGAYSDGNSADKKTQIGEYKATLSEYDLHFLEQYQMQSFGDFFRTPIEQPPYFPTWNITVVEGSKEAIAQENASRCNTEYLPRLVKCEERDFDALWTEYCAAFSKTGYDQFIDYLNIEIQKLME